MFTGIVKKTSKVENVKLASGGMTLVVKNPLGRVREGESIAVNGVCSTVKKSGEKIFFEYMPETLKLTNIGSLKKNDSVNLEQSLRFGDKLDGYIVLGHIDGKGEILKIKKEGNSKVFEIKVPQKGFMKFLVYKGSIAIEGISLTVAKVVKNSFVVKIIPYTLKHTNLASKKAGDAVNLEFDILAKYANQQKRK